MTATASPVQASTPQTGNPTQLRAFIGVLGRDLYVTWKEFPVFLAQVILQPLFLLFVFGKVLAELGYTQHGYSDLLFPGLLALTAVITGMQTLAFPLAIEFGWSKEVEDRLLAPMRTSLVAAEKLLYATVRAMVATAIMVPIGIIVLGSIPWLWSGLPLLLLALVFGSLLGAALGLVMGTVVDPERINIVFTLVFTPLLFTGCSQYPWPSLSTLRWFQIVTALNPMTYVSEAMRAAMVPTVPHITTWVCIVVLLGSTAGLLVIGIRGFYHRAID